MSVSGGDGSTSADGSVGGDIDAEVACTTVVRNQFDDVEKWESYQEDESSVDIESDQVRIQVAPKSVEGYAEIATVTTGLIGESELVASLAVAETTTGVAGISWYDTVEEDYFDLQVHSGFVEAIDKAAAWNEEIALCSPCMAYDPIAHARMRLLARAGTVYYQVGSADGEWIDVASTQVREGDYERAAFGWADGGQVSDSTVSEMTWLDCAF